MMLGFAMDDEVEADNLFYGLLGRKALACVARHWSRGFSLDRFFAGVFGMITYHLTAWHWAAIVAQVSVVLLVLVIVAAFAQNFIRGINHPRRPPRN